MSCLSGLSFVSSGEQVVPHKERRCNELNIRELEKMLGDLLETNPREAAEVAFVLAHLCSRGGDTKKATHFAKKSVCLFDSLEERGELKTMDDCATRFGKLGGVVLPRLIHEGVARCRLKDLGLRL